MNGQRCGDYRGPGAEPSPSTYVGELRLSRTFYPKPKNRSPSVRLTGPNISTGCRGLRRAGCCSRGHRPSQHSIRDPWSDAVTTNCVADFHQQGFFARRGRRDRRHGIGLSAGGVDGFDDEKDGQRLDKELNTKWIDRWRQTARSV